MLNISQSQPRKTIIQAHFVVVVVVLFCKDLFCPFRQQQRDKKKKKKEEQPPLFHCSHCVILCLGTAIVCCTVSNTMVFI